eukprot:gene11649-15601_t
MNTISDKQLSANLYSMIDDSIWNGSTNDFSLLFQFIPIALYSALMLTSVIVEKNFEHSICNESIEHSLSVLNVIGPATSFCFFVFGVCNLAMICHILFVSDSNKKFLVPLYVALLSICVISGSAMFFIYTSPERICKDVFGVPSNLIQWIEWLTTVPLLTYLGAIVGNNSSFMLKRDDSRAFISSLLMILFGFISSVVKIQWISYVGYVLSALCFILTIVQLERSVEVENDYLDSENLHIDLIKKLLMVRMSEKRFRMRLLMCIFALFPIIHFVGFVNVFRPDEVLFAYMVFGAIGKILFSKFLVDSHIHLQNETAKIVSEHKTNHIKTMFEQELNEFRHSIANAAHDLKTPLSGFCSGIDFIESVAEEIKKAAAALQTDHNSLSTKEFCEKTNSNVALVLDAIQNVGNNSSVDLPNKPELNFVSFCIDELKDYFSYDEVNRCARYLFPQMINEAKENSPLEKNKNEMTTFSSKDSLSKFITNEFNYLDDSITIQRMSGMVLRRDGHTVEMAENGAIALEMVMKSLENQDGGMEDESEGRNNQPKLHSIIIGCSANSDYETTQQAISCGADMFMEKPFNLSKFYNCWESLKVDT